MVYRWFRGGTNREALHQYPLGRNMLLGEHQSRGRNCDKGLVRGISLGWRIGGRLFDLLISHA
jgi:hypothetical protein